MADIFNTTTSIGGDESSLPRVARGTYNRNLLTRAFPLLVHQRYGQQKPLSQRSGQSMVFRRYEKLTQSTIALQEGITPPGTQISKHDVVATLKQYGNYAIITDWVDMTSVDPTINETSKLMGENMGESIDTIHANYLAAGTSFARVTVDGTSPAVGAGNRDTVAGCLTRHSIDLAIRTLNGNDAKRFAPKSGGSGKQYTSPIAAAFWAIIHTDQEHDIYQDESGFAVAAASGDGNMLGRGFVPVQHYGSNQGVMEGECGAYRNVRFVMSTNTKRWIDSGAAIGAHGLKSTTGTDIDVYSVLIIARDAYGIVPLGGNSAKVIVKSAKMGGASDPLEQRNSVGWKAATALAILNDAFMHRIECGSLI